MAMNQPQQEAVPVRSRDGYPSYATSPGIHRPYARSPVTSPHSPQQLVNFNTTASSPLNPHSAVPHLSPSFHGPTTTTTPATPSMAQSYNPQQWDQQQFGFQRLVQGAIGTRNVTGMEASMPSPPPPYSPSTTADASNRTRPSPMLDQRGFTTSPSNVDPSASTRSPIVRQSPTFPPPPSSRHRERSASGRIFNTIQTITGRGKQPAVDPYQQQEWGMPPAARRAASTGHIGQSSATVHTMCSRGDVNGATQRQNGVALPGPPPGPPPNELRSQSLNRYGVASSSSASSSSTAAYDASRRHAAMAPNLGTVPPTPANWVDGDDVQAVSTSQEDYHPLRIDTGAREHSLTRRPATRDTSAQGLRERRSRSKATQPGGDVDGQSTSRPGSSDQPSASHSHANQQRGHMRKVSGFAESSQGGRHQRPANVMTPPYTPATSSKVFPGPQSAASDRPRTSTDNENAPDSFYQESIERHRRFIEQEAAAATDEEKLEVFSNYLVHESRVRRDRYNTAYNAMAGQIVDLTRDMWRSYVHTTKRVTTPNTARSMDNPPSATSSRPDELTPATDEGSLDGDGAERSRQWGGTFQPILSPIPSMAVSTVPDEASSRGRAPSRWWEQSQASGSIGKPERIEKSHRETKYMGITAAMLRSSPQPSPELLRQSPPHNARTFLLGPDEYPPEKTDSGEYETPMATPSRVPQASVPSTPAAIDISRFITLPPPYPRHHPAINNNHPQLSELRADYRKLAIADELQRIRDSHLDKDWALKTSQQEAAKQRRAKMRRSMQDKLDEGGLTFADAAKIEASFDAEQIERGRKDARARFDQFEANVSHPLNTLVTERLALAEKCIAALCSDLDQHDKSVHPNRAQEEGDEHPERLEKLTLLRWLFEAREVLHRDVFDLHAQRAEQYGEVVLTPYRLAKQQNKIEEAEAFFLKDSHDRLASFSKDALARHETFLKIIERNVTRGLEDQLSAFWDIAPGLRDLIQQLPSVSNDGAQRYLDELNHLQIQIPPQEYEENASYKDYPLQYLYSLLGHAEKSAYQFIESQINLLCMLHAVRELTAEASLKALQLDRKADATTSPTTDLNGEMSQAKDAEGRRLTADLQDKVGEIERQWREALGDRLVGVKTGVRRWLEECGGWEDGLDG